MSTKQKNEWSALPEDVRWRLGRIDGFLDLRMPARARKELAELPASLAGTPPVRELQLRVAFEESDWPEATRQARALVAHRPDSAQYVVQLAYATRRAEGLAPAQFILEEAARKFPDVAVIPFNLACYECQAGRQEEAMQHLKRAFALDPAYREQALEDEDLKPLWQMLE